MNATKSQIDKFKQAAHDLETDESEERFDERLKKVAKPPPSKSEKSDDDKPAK